MPTYLIQFLHTYIENEDKLLWHPGQLESKDVENYLSKSQEAVQTGGVGSLPLGAHVRDDEQALYLLLQCGYSSEEALRRRRMNAIPTADTMTLWSEEECRAFISFGQIRHLNSQLTILSHL